MTAPALIADRIDPRKLIDPLDSAEHTHVRVPCSHLIAAANALRLSAQGVEVGRGMGIADAREAVAASAWKHEGDDTFSQGMDKGAREQVQASIDAIDTLALLTRPSPQARAQMVETGAIGLYNLMRKTFYDEIAAEEPWESLIDPAKQFWLDQSRAVLAALNIPGEVG